MNFVGLLALLRRRWLVLLLISLAGVLGGVVANERAEPVYSSTSRVFFDMPRGASVAEQFQGFQLTSQLLESYSRIATSRSAMDTVAERLAGSGVSTTRGKVTADPEPETLLLDVTAEGPTPEVAQKLAAAATDNLVQTVSRLEAGKETKIAPEVIDLAQLPTAPVSPRKRMNVFIGFALGVLLGVAAAVLLDAVDRRLRTAREAEESVSRPLLVAVPYIRALRKDPYAALGKSGARARETFKALRTAVQFINPDAPPRSMLVTSPMTGEGKTTVTLNLAVALAQAGERVILVDADLRRAELSKLLGVEPTFGLTTVIRDPSLLEQALTSWRGGLLQVMPSGQLPPDPSEMLGSQNMTEIVSELARRADVVLFDAAPVLPVTDAVTFASQVDAVLLVVYHGRTERPEVEETRRRLDRVGAKVAGFVYNGLRSRERGHEYYGYTPPPPARPAPGDIIPDVRGKQQAGRSGP